MKKTINFIKTFLAKFNLIANLIAKNLALHKQLIVLNRSIKKPQIKTKDYLFWIILYLFWNNWQESLIVLKPETVVGWHKKGFKDRTLFSPSHVLNKCLSSTLAYTSRKFSIKNPRKSKQNITLRTNCY